jgi:hypothetical protein
MFPHHVVHASTLLLASLTSITDSLLAQGCAGGMDVTGNECNPIVALQQPGQVMTKVLEPPSGTALRVEIDTGLSSAVIVAGEASMAAVSAQPPPAESPASTDTDWAQDAPLPLRR